MSSDTTKTSCAECGQEFIQDQLTPGADTMVCKKCRPADSDNQRRNTVVRGYLFGAVDADDNKVTDYVEAANLGAARYKLELRGYKDIVFYEDDVSLATQKLFGEQADHPPMAGDEYLNLSRGNSEVYAFWLYLKNNAFLNILMLAVLVTALFRDRPTHWSALVAYVYFALVLGYYMLASLPLRRYNGLVDAVEWGRWDEVEERIKGIRQGNRFALAKVPELKLNAYNRTDSRQNILMPKPHPTRQAKPAAGHC